MSTCAELEIKIQRCLDPNQGYPVVLSLFGIDPKQDQRFPAEPASAFFKIDLGALQLIKGEYQKYDTTLSRAFFQDKIIRDALEAAQKVVDNEHGDAALRVRLFLDAGAEPLHGIRWECLRDPAGKPLFNGDNVLFSRYLSSSSLRPLCGKTELKALLAIANPPHLDQACNPEDPSKGLPPVDVAGEKDRAMKGLKAAGFATITTLAAAPTGTAPATSDNILDELAKGYDVFYLVCHGGLVGDDQVPMLWLEDGQEPVNANLLVERIRNKAQDNLPRLVVLASCQSAGADGKSIAASGTLSALGPKLSEAGVPAVIAMQGTIQMKTVDQFMPCFFKELARDGQIDRAMGAARGLIVGNPDQPNCLDYWMPALFMRLRSGRLWYKPGIGGTGELDTWKAINHAAQSIPCRCTPIIGPGSLEGLVGPWREVAKSLATYYGYPETSHLREDLPTVMQYIAINQTTPLEAKQLLVERIATDLKKGMRFASPAMDAFDPEHNLACVPDVISEAGRIFRQQNELEPHRLLASRPFTTYITVNPDDLMEDALREAGREPRSDFNRWNTDEYFDLLNKQKYPPLPDDYKPTADQPLVYHIFGKLRLPAALPASLETGDPAEEDVLQKASREEAGCGSYVVTEDDYFKYLLTVNSQADAKTLIPRPVQSALTANALLFFGFRLDDWSFRVLLRSIFNKEGSAARGVGENVKPCIGAQVQPDEERIENPVRAAAYYEKYFQGSKINTFWGNVNEFAQAVDREIPPVDRYFQAIQQKLGITR
jgi:hypothetical protein